MFVDFHNEWLTYTGYCFVMIVGLMDYGDWIPLFLIVIFALFNYRNLLFSKVKITIKEMLVYNAFKSLNLWSCKTTLGVWYSIAMLSFWKKLKLHIGSETFHSDLNDHLLRDNPMPQITGITKQIIPL